LKMALTAAALVVCLFHLATSIPLIPAPGVIEPRDGAVVDASEMVRTARLVLKWSAVPEAARYQINVEGAQGPIKGSPFSVAGTTLSLTLTLPKPGTPDEYRWRVTGLAKDGSQGTPSDAKFSVKRDLLQAPKLKAPKDGAVFDAAEMIPYPRVTLQWSEVPKAWDYLVEVTLGDKPIRGSPFSNPTTNLTIFTGLPEQGTRDEFQWKVCGIYLDGGRGEYSNAKFSIKRDRLPAPTILGPQNGTVVKNSDLALQWSEVKGALHYIIFVTGDQGPVEGNPFSTTETLLPVHVNLPKPGGRAEYNWRVTALGKDNLPGEWGYGGFYVEN
jgi:hypothetical protein